jgi:hypothetical protein
LLPNQVEAEKLNMRLSGEGVEFQSLHPYLKQYYSYKGKGHESWMASMFLSPRGIFDESKGFNCCKSCYKNLGMTTKPCRIKLPPYAIANRVHIGDAPLELTRLNDVELALVSMVRMDKHVFTFYGGAHKLMRGWHNLYENNVHLRCTGERNRLVSTSSSTLVGTIFRCTYRQVHLFVVIVFQYLRHMQQRQLGDQLRALVECP